MNVYIRETQETLECDVLKENFHTVWIKLPNNDAVKKHKNKNLINGMINISKIKSEVTK